MYKAIFTITEEDIIASILMHVDVQSNIEKIWKLGILRMKILMTNLKRTSSLMC
uniref:AlNc14C57G4312 protein n=1 Tax=Albugo laibachii Nc14 TaxID=890382 RepID=F0WCD2_9STRA|nr:AlNc14C57G4312 [Albugo laibachii Nc14]|eukprot:CCA18847.1 AlNc14C57G4312 [Albugo laibachii Nc14]